MEIYETTAGRKKSFFGNVNLILIAANVLFFVVFNVLRLTNLTGEDFISFMALNPSNVFQGKYLWTFVTSMFMHGDFFHVLANMFSLFFMGSLAEKILGKKRYLYFYLASGLFAGVFFVLISYLLSASQILPGDFNAFAVGASGALFGIVGILMMLTPNLPVYVMFIPIPVKMKYAAPGMLILLWIISLAANIPIGNTAHLGGLLFGLTFGLFLKKKYKNKTRYISKYFS